MAVHPLVTAVAPAANSTVAASRLPHRSEYRPLTPADLDCTLPDAPRLAGSTNYRPVRSPRHAP